MRRLPGKSAAAFKETVRAMDGNLPVENLQTLDQIRASSIAPERFRVTLLGLFAMTALLLAAIGIYGVLSSAVTHRRGEIGVRMALGAKSDDLMKGVLAQGVRMTLIGVTAGLIGAVSLTRILSGLLFGVSTTDPMTYLMVSGLFVMVALAACLIPAAKAIRTDPMIILKTE